MNKTLPVIFLGLLGVLLSAYAHDAPPLADSVSATPAPGLTVPATPQLHSITLPHFEPDFPPGPGRETFLVQCVICHSPRYISDQPRFPRKTWKKEVGKMIKDYGAHINEAQAAQIVDYLVSIKGKPDKADKP